MMIMKEMPGVYELLNMIEKEMEDMIEGVVEVAKLWVRIGALCLMGGRLVADNNPNNNQGNGTTVIIEEDNDPYSGGPYWMGPGIYDGIWFGYPEAYYGYYNGRGYYDHDGNWNHEHGHEGGYHGGGYHGGGGHH